MHNFEKVETQLFKVVAMCLAEQFKFVHRATRDTLGAAQIFDEESLQVTQMDVLAREGLVEDRLEAHEGYVQVRNLKSVKLLRPMNSSISFFRSSKIGKICCN